MSDSSGRGESRESGSRRGRGSGDRESVGGERTGRASAVRERGGSGSGGRSGAREHGGRARRGRGGSARRPAPRPLRWWRWLLLLLLTVATVLALVLYFTPLLGVRSVEVGGAATIGKGKVVRAADVRRGTPMLRVDESGIEQRVSRLPRVDSVRVRLVWPSTVRVEITERVPVVFAATPQGFRLIDDEGVAFATVPKSPSRLPEIRVRNPGRDDPATEAALKVVTALPESVRGEVTAVVAEQPDNVRLLLTGGRTVQWGSTRLTARKAAILPALLTRPGTVYDVTSPALPTVS